MMMSAILNRLRCYPPAETHIPFKAVRQSIGLDSTDAREAICEALGVTHCLLGPSGRSLLYQLLTSLARRADGGRNEVLIPAYTCYSVASAVAKAGLKIRLYDLIPETLGIAMDSVTHNQGQRTLAVITQHLLGIPTDVHSIRGMAQDAGVWHIEDAAQALGGTLDGKPLGAGGDFGLLSFGRGKPLPLGSGGALVSDETDPAQILPKTFVHNGWKPILRSLLTQPAAHPLVYGIAEALPLGLGRTEFNPHFANGRIPLALIKLVKPMMAQLPDYNRHRSAIAAVYRRNLPSRCLVSLPEKGTPVFPRYPVLARGGPLPARLMRLGVRRLYPCALHQEPAIVAHIANPPRMMAGAEKLAQQLITLPTHHAIGVSTAERIARSVDRWIAAPH